MSKILISTFDSERAAFEGVSALKELHRDGDITVYATSVIAKDADGNVAVRQAADEGPVGTLVGLVTGGLVGLIGGPVGVAVGSYIGGFAGVMHDLFKAGVSLDFVDDASRTMTPGSVAIVAEIDETWVTPVDTRLGALGGATIRRMPGDVADEQLARDTQAANAELEQLDAELRQSSGAAKANVEAAIERQRRKLEELADRLDKTLDQQTASFQARLATLRAQRDQATDRRREQIDARMEELKTSHEVRKAKLEESRRLAKESIEQFGHALVG